MAESTPHCSLAYHRFGPVDLDTFAHLVSEGIYDNSATFTSPPYTKVAFDALVSAHHDKYEAYKNGGKAQKGAYMTSKTNLMKALDDTADYIDALPGVNEDMILLGGYTPTKTGETKAVVPDAPVIDKIERGGRGVLEPSCDAVNGAEAYGCFLLDKPIDSKLIFLNGLLAFDDGFDSNFILNLTKGRRKLFTGLNPGSEYWFYFYAVNSAGVSTLSAGVSAVCGN